VIVLDIYLLLSKSFSDMFCLHRFMSGNRQCETISTRTKVNSIHTHLRLTDFSEIIPDIALTHLIASDCMWTW